MNPDGTTLKIEVTSAGGGSTSPAASSSSPEAGSSNGLGGGKTFKDMRDEQYANTRAFNQRLQEEKMQLEREKNARKNEKFLQELEAKAAKNAPRDPSVPLTEKEAEKARREQLQRDKQQDRDEAFFDRQNIAAERKAKREQDAAARRQERDESWHENDQRKKKREEDAQKQREWWNNPSNVAQSMKQRGEFQSQVRGSMFAQRLGFSAESSVTKFAASANLAAARMQPLIAVASTLYGAWKAAQQNLLDEAKRVQRFSPDLQMQNLVNKMRNFKTDMEIAAQYGEQMAKVSDRENRQEQATRKIGVAVSSVVDTIFEPFAEGYTQLLEWIAGTGKVSADTNKYLEKLVGLTEKQLEELGIKGAAREGMALALKNAEKVLKTISMGDGGMGFDKEDQMTGQFANVVAGPRGGNADFIQQPDFWRNR